MEVYLWAFLAGATGFAAGIISAMVDINRHPVIQQIQQIRLRYGSAAANTLTRELSTICGKIVKQYVADKEKEKKQ